MGKAATIGFDFGTSTTMVAHGDEVLSLGANGRARFMPSVVGFDDAGSMVVGEAAEFLTLPIRSIKRAITEGREYVRVGRHFEGVDERADPLMVELFREAVRRSGSADAPVQRRGLVRLGCPAMWTGEQRRRLVEIANSAGLPLKLGALVDEPVAAGIAWLAGDRAPRPEQFRMLVFDMGGGTLDIAVLDVYGHRDVAVLAAFGIPTAGDVLDDAIVTDLRDNVGAQVKALDNPESAWAELRLAARDLKVQLSTDDEAVVTLSQKYFGGPEIWYTRAQLEEVFNPQMDEAVMAIGLALRLAKLTERAPGNLREVAHAPIDDVIRTVDVVVLAGGMAHVPYVRTRLEVMFGAGIEVVHAYPAADDTSLLGREPELAIALGLAQADHFGRINVFRPALDIQLKIDGKRDLVSLYEAFTPLMDQGKLRAGSTDVRYVRTGRDLRLPGAGTGTIRVVSHNGSPVQSTLDGRSLDGFPVTFDGQKFEFSLYSYGRIRLIDGAGTHEGQFDDWHIL